MLLARSLRADSLLLASRGCAVGKPTINDVQIWPSLSVAREWQTIKAAEYAARKAEQDAAVNGRLEAELEMQSAAEARARELLIEERAKRSAAELRAQGWRGGGEAYDLGTYPGDLDALTIDFAADARVGRKPTRDERMALEAAIRAELSR